MTDPIRTSRNGVSPVKSASEQIFSFGRALEDRRQFDRQTLLWAATLEVRGQKIKGTLIDFSAGGARLSFDEPITEGDELKLVIKELGELDAKVVWRSNGEAGLKFVLAPEEVAGRVQDLLPAPLRKIRAAPAQKTDLGYLARFGAVIGLVLAVLTGISFMIDDRMTGGDTMPLVFTSGETDQHTCSALLAKVADSTNQVDFAHYMAEAYQWHCVVRDQVGGGKTWVTPGQMARMPNGAQNP